MPKPNPSVMPQHRDPRMPAPSGAYRRINGQRTYTTVTPRSPR